MKFAYEANAWGGVVGTAGAPTDIHTGFYLTPGDVKSSLKAISDAGFSGVELFDGNLLPFENNIDEFRDELADVGLELTGVYSGGHLIYEDAHNDELARFRRSVNLAAAAGAKHYVIGGGAVRHNGRQEKDYEVAAKLLDQVVDLGEAAGLVVSYHPHLGSLAQAPEQVDALMNASKIALCADVAHLAAGGADPAAVIRKYSGRLKYVHLKDLNKTTGEFLPLGEGDIDLEDVINAVIESGYQDWVTVELDGYTGDVDAAARRSLEYLNRSKLT